MAEHQGAMKRVTEYETLCAATMSLARNARRKEKWGGSPWDRPYMIWMISSRDAAGGTPILGTFIRPALQTTVLSH